MTFLPINGRPFLFFFGGANADNNVNTAELIAVDLDRLVWWRVPVSEGPVNPRKAVCMVGIADHLYIFGGYHSRILNSFSIAKFENGSWRWIVCDQVYPSSVPPLGYGGCATPVYGGAKILLTNGRPDETTSIKLSKETTVLFDTVHYTFQVQTGIAGDFPMPAGWYNLSPAHFRPMLPTLRLPHQLKNTPSISLIPACPHPQALMCAWIPEGEEYFCPEIWEYLLHPHEEIRCLNLRQEIWDLDLDLQAFCTVGTSAYLLGYDDKCDKRPVWNVCVELKLDME
jgi:hypothetical protein